MVDKILIVVIPLALMLVGMAILWVQAKRALEGRIRPSDRAAHALAVTGWILILVGFFAAIGVMSHVCFILAWLIAGLILVSLLYRYLSMERRSLLWMIMLADRQRIPLEKAARAFADERRDLLGNQALDLAEYLEAGLPLALALKRSGLSYPPAVLLAMDLGQQTGDLQGALRRVLERSEDTVVVLQTAVERAFYLVLLVIFFVAAMTFLVIWIVPSLEKIFYDMGAELPDAPIWLITVTRFWMEFWPVLVVPAGVILIVLSGYVYRNTGFSFRSLPGFHTGWNCTNRSVLMQWLALAVRQNRPLPDMMRLMIGYLTSRGPRRRLSGAIKRIDQGMPWTESLYRTGWIRKSESAVFQAAERAGNLAWALEEMAESSVRRSVYRFRAAMNVIFPITILGMGGVVLVLAMSIWSPLIQMIHMLI